MTDTPDDIQQQAIHICYEYEPSEHAICVAIMRERERCYKIAMSHRSFPSRDMDAYGTTLAIDIASAIRSGASS